MASQLGRNQLVEAISLARRSVKISGVGEVDLDVGGQVEGGVVGQFAALVPGQGLGQVGGVVDAAHADNARARVVAIPRICPALRSRADEASGSISEHVSKPISGY